MGTKVYVVSESIDNARLDQLYLQFPSYDGYFTVTPAVMGATLATADYYNYVCVNYNYSQRILSPGEVGCALSHLNIYNKIIEDNAPAIVFEDDVIGNDEALTQALELAGVIKPNQILILGGMNGLAEEKLLKFVNNDSSALTKLNPSVKKLHPLAYQDLRRTCCYIIGAEAAAIIAKQQQSCLVVADDWGTFSKNNSLDFYYADLLDHPVVDESLNSYLEQERRKLVYLPSYKLALRGIYKMLLKKKDRLKLLKY